MTALAILGITGRMGQTLLRALAEEHAGRIHLTGALASPHSPSLGRDAALQGRATGILVTADVGAALQGAVVAVDFSVAQAVKANAEACAAAGVALLVGTTGFALETRQRIESLAARIPILVAANTSHGVTVVAHLVREAARALGSAYEVEISEAHHRMKRDAPSGTALALGHKVAEARGVNLEDVAVFDRHGRAAPRRAEEIGFTALRAGDIVGEHTVTFAVDGERVEITHRATDRIVFASGALQAAEWLAGQPPGLYSMDDTLRR